MYDPAYIAFVYSHTERDCSAYHLSVSVYEFPLGCLPVLGRHACMIADRFIASSHKLIMQRFCRFTGYAVDYAGIVPVPVYHIAYIRYPASLAGVRQNLQAQIRTVERSGPYQRRPQPELHGYVAPCKSVGCGCERKQRYIGKSIFQMRELGIYRSEIVSPLRYAVCFVDSYQTHRHCRGPMIHLGQQTLRRYVKQLHTACEELIHSPHIHLLVDIGIDCSGRNTVCHQGTHLIVHQGYKRRHNHSTAIGKQCRQLIAHRFPSARGHKYKRVTLLCCHCSYYLELSGAELAISIEAAQKSRRPPVEIRFINVCLL